MIDSRAVALQGVGFSPLSLAVQGFLVIGGTGRRFIYRGRSPLTLRWFGRSDLW